MESKIIEKYMGRERVPSSLCCFTMLLEYLGKEDDLERVRGRFSTIRGAMRVLPKLFDYTSLHDFIIDSGFHEVDTRFLQDGDLVLDDFHTYIVYGDVLFGVGKDSVFKPHRVNNITNNQNVKTYRRNK
ncbi:hypothetical protein [Aeromonas hydrophila]|uniref:hypothetical protein n=1 Tax=Aeromonas hydrophila TaxID=644 RepID=UPI003D1D7B2F